MCVCSFRLLNYYYYIIIMKVIFMSPPTIGGGSIMFSGGPSDCPSVRCLHVRQLTIILRNAMSLYTTDSNLYTIKYSNPIQRNSAQISVI